MSLNIDDIAYYILGVGAALVLIAYVWFLIRAFRTDPIWGWCMFVPLTILPFSLFRLRQARGPLGLLLLGGVVISFAMVYSKLEQRFRTFGERERIVEGERHITLTGWDKSDYSLLVERSDVVVLQMANPDVTNETLQYLQGLEQLRELDLENTSITDEGLAILAKLPALESLRLSNTKITDEGFRKYLLEKESLLNLDLTGTKGVLSKTLREWRKLREGRRYVN